jgi:ATP-binding cassette subfamily B protein
VTFVRRGKPAGEEVGWAGLRTLLETRRRPISALAIASLLGGLTESGILAIVAQGAAAIVSGSSNVRLAFGPAHLNEPVDRVLFLAIGLALFRLAIQVVLSVVPARIAADVQAEVRRDLFDAFTRAAWDEQSRDREGHLQELMTSQSTMAVQAPLNAALLIVTGMTFLVLVVSALVLDVVAAVAVLGASVALFLLLRPFSRIGTNTAARMSYASLRYAGGVSEAVRLAEETRVFGVSDAQRSRVGALIAEVREPFWRTQMLARLIPGIYQSLIYLLVAVALLALDATGSGRVATLGAVVLLLVRAGSYGQQVQGAYQYVRQALPFLDRVEDAQRRYAAAVSVAGDRPLRGIESLGFEDVCFSYESDQPVLTGIDFGISRREAVGIVGPTGAGKSTLVQILLGLREPTSGRYVINGKPANECDRRDWKRAVSYLPQEPRLLHASVAENIRFFRDLSDESIEHAARIAGIHEEIVSWPAGYATLVGPRADAVSGGQQQRICLARALATRPELLVLDEPTSALDPRTQLQIQESLAALTHELMLFVVAHRMSALSICDRVMVIVDGRLEAFDTVGALEASSAYYRAASAATFGAANLLGLDAGKIAPTPT